MLKGTNQLRKNKIKRKDRGKAGIQALSKPSETRGRQLGVSVS